jgi:hypothetical protein
MAQKTTNILWMFRWISFIAFMIMYAMLFMNLFWDFKKYAYYKMGTKWHVNLVIINPNKMDPSWSWNVSKHFIMVIIMIILSKKWSYSRFFFPQFFYKKILTFLKNLKKLVKFSIENPYISPFFFARKRKTLSKTKSLITCNITLYEILHYCKFFCAKYKYFVLWLLFS